MNNFNKFTEATEEKSILKVYNNILKYNNKHKTNYDIIVINDGSSDNTEQILINNNIHLLIKL